MAYTHYFEFKLIDIKTYRRYKASAENPLAFADWMLDRIAKRTECEVVKIRRPTKPPGQPAKGTRPTVSALGQPIATPKGTFFTVKAAADAYGVSFTEVANWVQDGKPGFKLL